jgi:hypothetical protein
MQNRGGPHLKIKILANTVTVGEEITVHLAYLPVPEDECIAAPSQLSTTVRGVVDSGGWVSAFTRKRLPPAPTE